MIRSIVKNYGIAVSFRSKEFLMRFQIRPPTKEDHSAALALLQDHMISQTRCKHFIHIMGVAFSSLLSTTYVLCVTIGLKKDLNSKYFISTLFSIKYIKSNFKNKTNRLFIRDY